MATSMELMQNISEVAYENSGCIMTAASSDCTGLTGQRHGKKYHIQLLETISDKQVLCSIDHIGQKVHELTDILHNLALKVDDMLYSNGESLIFSKCKPKDINVIEQTTKMYRPVPAPCMSKMAILSRNQLNPFFEHHFKNM